MNFKIANKIEPKSRLSKIELISEILEEEENIPELGQLLAKIPGIRHKWRMWGRPLQFMPRAKDWQTWAILADRGFGKTRAAAEGILEWVRKGEKRRIAFLGTSVKEAEQMLTGESGIFNLIPPGTLTYKYIKTQQKVRFDNGVEIYLYPSTEPNRIHGAQFDGAWIEEITHHIYPKAAEFIYMSLRIGANPQAIVTIDKRHIEAAQSDEEKFHCDGAVRLLAYKSTYTSIGETLDNVSNLSPGFVKMFTEKYLKKGANLQNA